LQNSRIEVEFSSTLGCASVVSKPVRMPDSVRFGEDFELDVRAYELRCAGLPLKLKPIPMELLLFLVERGGELVTREQIVERIWGKGVFLDTDNSINGAISRIRQLLRDDPEKPRYVQTVTGKGYRFIAPVVEINAAPVEEPDPALPRTSPDRLLGVKVSHYRVLQMLGGGGMGVVYEAEDLKLGRRVAMKFLPAELSSDSTALQRLQREARAASSLDHPNICAVYELGEHEGQPFIVMQLLEGQTLREWIEKAVGQKTFVRTEQLLSIAIEIARGLEAAHQKGIIHRDIKPANIFITTRGETKILDFGVAKFLEAVEPAETPLAATSERQGPSVRSPDPSLTRTGASLGTPSYLSPEQVRGEKLDARTDLFSFGLVLYEMATGQQAFPGKTAAVIRDAVLSMPAVPLRQLDPELPPRLESIVDQVLQKDRSRRYQSAGELRTDLKELQILTASELQAENLGAAKPDVNLTRIFRIGKVARVAALAIAVGFLGVLIAYAFRYRLQRAKRLTERDTIVLADFANSTNDRVFDGTLKQGLSVALGQSPFLNILPESRVRATLRLMRQPENVAISNELAGELCQRSESKAYVSGAIAALGSEYVIGLKAENCQIGETLAEEQVTAKSKEEVISMLGRAAAHLRQELGESISTIRKFDVPLREATTSSLEALKEFTIGGQIENEVGAAAAIPYYQKAIALDPLFARAYSALANQYSDTGENALAATYAAKAFQLRDHCIPAEKHLIEAVYHESVTGDLPKAIEAYELLAEVRPTFPNPHINLGYIYSQLGESEKALAETLHGLSLGLSSGAYTDATANYIALGRLNEAKATFAEAESHNKNMPLNHNNLYLVAFLEHDQTAMDREAAWAIGEPEVEDVMLYSQSCTKAYVGELKEARELSRRASDFAIRAGQKETAASYRADAAIREALFGNSLEAQRWLHTTSQPSSGPDVKAAAALAYALSGNQARSQSLADDLGRQFPQNTIVQYNYLPAIRAQIALNSGDTDRALDLLKPALSYELGQPAQAVLLNLYPVFVRGSVYLAAHDGKAAAAEFQKILDHPGMALNEPVALLAHLALARASALTGDDEKARSEYQDFLMLWKNADPEIPVLKRAKTEYARLSQPN
jgi:serine/threonine protein kinase